MGNSFQCTCLLLFFQDVANYLSGSLHVAQDLGLKNPASGTGCGTHASRKISANPTEHAEELAFGNAGSPAALLSLDKAVTPYFPGCT